MTATLEQPAATWQPGPWDIDNAGYHADCECVSHSSLEVFRESPARFRARYVTRTIPRDEPTPQMRIGSALHCKLLTPDRWDAEIAVGPPEGCEGRSKAAIEGKRVWLDLVRHKTVISPDEESLVNEMALAALQCEAAGEFLRNTKEAFTEQAYRWTDPGSGIRIKFKPDRFWTAGVMLDVKTAADPSPDGFRKAVANYAYYRQSALYLAGAAKLFDLNCQHIFIVIGKEPPHDVGVYDLDLDALELGRKENRQTLGELAEALETGVFQASWQRDVTTLSLPKWCFYRE